MLLLTGKLALLEQHIVPSVMVYTSTSQSHVHLRSVIAISMAGLANENAQDFVNYSAAPGLVIQLD